MAGLAAAVRLSERHDLKITLWEATQRAGGRCWSFHDAKLDRQIDNGNHLVLSGNGAVLDYARRIGSDELLSIASDATFPFFDRRDGSRSLITIPSRLTDIVRGKADLPGSTAAAALDVIRLVSARQDATVAQAVPGRGRLWNCLWEPLTLAVLNEPPERGSARLLAAVLRRTLLRGSSACRPVFFPQGLGPTLVDPAIAHLRRRGIDLRWRGRLAALRGCGDRIHQMEFRDGECVEIGQQDGVIIAAAAAHAAVFPDRPQPRQGLSIVNAHFRVPAVMADRMPPILGVTSGSAHWIFRRHDVLSVTVSAADSTGIPLLDSAEALQLLWHDVAASAGCPDARPTASRLIRERHATWEQSPQGDRLRPHPCAPYGNVALAGDYVASQLPATLEGAITSGQDAADRICC